MLVAMTCCQDKAKDAPALYGFGQREWHDLCVTSALTNTEVPKEPGTAREIALRKLQEGKEAMYKLDMARVEYLRRHGFAAELRTTDKFPKGDVIIARRLPTQFMSKLDELRRLERENPLAFDAIQMKLDAMAKKRGAKARKETFGDEWTEQDVEEMIRRLRPDEAASKQESKERRARAAADALQRQREQRHKEEQEERERAERAAEKIRRELLVREIFHDAGGGLTPYLQRRASETGRPVSKGDFGAVARTFNELVSSNTDSPMVVRAKFESKLNEMGY